MKIKFSQFTGFNRLAERKSCNRREGLKEKVMVVQLPTIHDLQRSWIGADRFFERFASMPTYEDTSYPRFNITKDGDNSYMIEVALAGYKKENIVVERKENVLSIHGEKSLKDVADESYLHRGITRKAFKRSFTISEDVKIDKATFVDGILTVDLHVEIPEERRPRKIEIE
jgi:molecular chaperone IbpA